MGNHKPQAETTGTVGVDRRAAVLNSALVTFARFGYRKTSMEEVAKAARISRPGLYFLFASKEDLFRAAVSQALEEDIAEVGRILEQSDRSLRARLLDSFDRWAGRYIGPMTRDIASVIEDNPALLGGIVESFPRRFADLVTNAIAAQVTNLDRGAAVALTQTMISTAIGIKYQVDNREQYGERFAIAVDLLLR
ncbi:TetR/AcrR family transcriptional regulator [Glaciihabitans sp. UYNi722]|uniref:TetR/AcrR family transcriptional regulator n=1 Tax=Glaciihabitans sp. UYNi722 TaxID=3156344 RepID=UPI0033926AC6